MHMIACQRLAREHSMLLRKPRHPHPHAITQALPSPDAAAHNVFVASGRRVYSIAVPRGAAGFAGERGKEGVHVPATAEPVSAAVMPAIQHRAEIQHLALHEQPGSGQAVLASVDCYGRAVVAQARRLEGRPGLHVTGVHQLQPADLLRCRPTSRAARVPGVVAAAANPWGALLDACTADWRTLSARPLRAASVTAPPPTRRPRREPGWAGVAVAPGQPSQAAVARGFARDVTLFDGPMAVRSLHTMYRPSAVQLLSTSLATGPQGGPLVAVAEGPQVSVWDVRGAGRGARVARLTPGPHHGHLFCLAATEEGSGTPLIGAATPAAAADAAAVIAAAGAASAAGRGLDAWATARSCMSRPQPRRPPAFPVLGLAPPLRSARRRRGQRALGAGVGAAQVDAAGPLGQLPEVRGHRPALLLGCAALRGARAQRVRAPLFGGCTPHWTAVLFGCAGAVAYNMPSARCCRMRSERACLHGVAAASAPLVSAGHCCCHCRAGNPRLCYVGGFDYEVLCGEWGGNKASRLGGGNRSANATHTGLKTGPAATAAAAADAG